MTDASDMTCTTGSSHASSGTSKGTRLQCMASLGFWNSLLSARSRGLVALPAIMRMSLEKVLVPAGRTSFPEMVFMSGGHYACALRGEPCMHAILITMHCIKTHESTDLSVGPCLPCLIGTYPTIQILCERSRWTKQGRGCLKTPLAIGTVRQTLRKKLGATGFSNTHPECSKKEIFDHQFEQ